MKQALELWHKMGVAIGMYQPPDVQAELEAVAQNRMNQSHSQRQFELHRHLIKTG